MADDKFIIVTQAKLTFWGFMVILLSIAVNIFIMGWATRVLVWIIFIVLAVVFVLTAYQVNCMVVGKCVTAAWGFGISIVVGAALSLVATVVLFYIITKNKKNVSIK